MATVTTISTSAPDPLPNATTMSPPQPDDDDDDDDSDDNSDDSDDSDDDWTQRLD